MGSDWLDSASYWREEGHEACQDLNVNGNT